MSLRMLGVTLGVWMTLMAVIGSAQITSRAQESYPQHPDSLQKEGVPAGRVMQATFADSRVFPGTQRDYWVYIPAQYDGSKPAALMVFQDGRNYASRDRGFRVPNVFDNLIRNGEMPVTIGLFINPGVVPAIDSNSQPRFNRSFEYDSVDDRYANFLLEEMIPKIVKEYDLRISTDPNLRGICGSSSGGICAFNVAWQRPDQFRRVFTTVGTYVPLRGGHELHNLVRKTEPKPLRIYLQDGSNDQHIYGGDWWMANQMMLRALQWAGYEVNHTWGEGFHGGKHGIAILPDVMRWLWRDAESQPVSTHVEQSNSEAKRFLLEGHGWELVSAGHEWAEGLVTTDDGTLYVTDVPASKLYRIGQDGRTDLVVEDTGRANGISLGPDGRIYGACSGAKQIRAWDLKTFEMEVISQGTRSNDIVVRHDGTIYYTDPVAGKIWSIDAESRERTEVDQFPQCNGIALSSDQSQLLVAHFPGRFVYSYQIAPDRSLRFKQPFYHLEIPINQPSGSLDGMCTSVDGWLICSTASGIQICDQPGRSHFIMPLPPGARRPCYVAFGGENNQTLYVANVDRVWKRKTQLVGAKNWRQPIKPPKPRL